MRKRFFYISIFFSLFFAHPQVAKADAWAAIQTVVSFTFGNGLLEPCTKSAIKSFYGRTYNGVSTRCDEFEEPSLTDEVAGVFSSNKKVAVCSANAMVKNIMRGGMTIVGALFGGPLAGYIIGNIAGNALECLIIAAKAKGAFKKATEYEICFSGDGEGSPLPYTDRQIVKLLSLSHQKITVENIVDKYDKLCIHKVGTNEYEFHKDGDIYDNIYVHHADGYAYIMCASVFSACPCIYNIGRGVITEPEYKRDDHGVIQLDEQGHLAFVNDEEKEKYETRYAKHCRIIRYKDLYEQQDDLASIFDEACFDLHGYSKRTATITAGIVQCFENTARNIFEKPIMSVKHKSSKSDTITKQYNADIGIIEDVYQYLKKKIIQDRKYDNIVKKKEADLSELEKKNAIGKIKHFWFGDLRTTKIEYECGEAGKTTYRATKLSFYDKYIAIPSVAVSKNCCEEDNYDVRKTCFDDVSVAYTTNGGNREGNSDILTAMTINDDYEKFSDQDKQTATLLIYSETAKIGNLLEKIKDQRSKSIKAHNAEMSTERNFSLSLFDIFRNKVKVLAVLALTFWFVILGWKAINGDMGKMNPEELGKMALRVFLCYMIVFSESAKNYIFNLAIQTSQGVGMALNDIMSDFRSQKNNSWNNACIFTSKASASPKKTTYGSPVTAIKVTTAKNICQNSNHLFANSKYTKEGHTITAYWKAECPSGFNYAGCVLYSQDITDEAGGLCLKARCSSSSATELIPAVKIETITGIQSDTLLEEYKKYYRSLAGYGLIYTYTKGKAEKEKKDFCITYDFNVTNLGSFSDGYRNWNDVGCPLNFQDGKMCSDGNCYSGYCYRRICNSSETQEQCRSKQLSATNSVFSLLMKRPSGENGAVVVDYDYTFSCANEASELYCIAYDAKDKNKCIESECRPWKLYCENGMSLTCGRNALNADGTASDTCLTGVCYKDLTDFMPRPPFERPYKVFQYYSTRDNRWVSVKPRCHRLNTKREPIYDKNDPLTRDPVYSSYLNDFVYTCSEEDEKKGYVLDDGYRVSDLIALNLIGSGVNDILVFQNLLSYEEQEQLSDDEKVDTLKHAVIRTAVATIDSNGVVEEYNFIDDQNAAEGTLRAQYRIYLDSKLKALNRNSDYPVLKKYGGTRSYKHVSFWDSMDCKIIQFLTFTGGDQGFKQGMEDAISSVASGNSQGMVDGVATAFLQFAKFIFMVFPFGIIVFALMFAIGAALFMLVARAAQQYIVCVFNLVLVVYLSPFVFLLWLFDQTKDAMKSWIKDLTTNIVGACVPFVTISMFLFIIDWTMFGDTDKYVEENMFTAVGGINPECYDGHESQAPVGCLAVRLMKQFQMWDSILNYLISWVAIFKKDTWVIAGYLVYRALFAVAIIVVMTMMLDKIEDEIYKITGGKPDADIGGGFNQSASSSIKTGGLAGLQAARTGWGTFTGMHKLGFKVLGKTFETIGGLFSIIGGIAKALGADGEKFEKIANTISNLPNKTTKAIGKVIKKVGKAITSTVRQIGTAFDYNDRKTNLETINKNIDGFLENKISYINKEARESKKMVLERHKERIFERQQAMKDSIKNYTDSVNSRTDLNQAAKDAMINDFKTRSESQYRDYERKQKERMDSEMNIIIGNTEANINQAREEHNNLKAKISGNSGNYDSEDIEHMKSIRSQREMEEYIKIIEHIDDDE